MQRFSLFDWKRDEFSRLNFVSVLEGSKETVITAPEPAASEPTLQRDESVLADCRTCGVSFLSVDKQHAHYKSDLHRFNLKLKLSGGKVVTADEFQELLAAGELSDDSSGDTSDEDDDDDALDSGPPLADEADDDDGPRAPLSPKVTFVTSTGARYSVWRNVLLSRTDARSGADSARYLQALRLLMEPASKRVWSILMVGGGHFAAAVFEEARCLHHKTFHRYTTRRKQGGSQSSHDAKGHNAKSAGANLRRFNEQRLREDVAELLGSWRPEIQRSTWVFMCSPGVGNRSIFFFKDSPLERGDPRIQSVPFVTKRPTLVECKRIHQWLSTVDHLPPGAAESDADTAASVASAKSEAGATPKTAKAASLPAASESAASSSPAAETAPEPAEEDLLIRAIETDDLAEFRRVYESGYKRPTPADAMQLTSALFVAVALNRGEFVAYLLEAARNTGSRRPSSETDAIDFQVPSWHFRTALHRASSDGREELVSALLEAGASPTLKCMLSKSPYDLSKTKAVRNAFRKFAGQNPDKWDYATASIPMLTEEMEEEQERKKKEKKKQKRKNQQENARQKKIDEQQAAESEKKRLEEQRLTQELQRVALEREARLKTMTDREKRAEAAERRLAMMSGGARRCDGCQQPLQATPFERLEFKYCSTACVQQHRKLINR